MKRIRPTPGLCLATHSSCRTLQHTQRNWRPRYRQCHDPADQITDIDKGWLVIRHHANEQQAHGYLDCIGDFRPLPYHHSGQMVWQTRQGIFTLIHRPAFLGTLEHLIAYVTKVPAEGYPDVWEDA